MFGGWVELFDRFIESMTESYEDRGTGIFQIARHACGMVIILMVVVFVMCFQSIMTGYDYATLRQDYTELSAAYLKHSDVYDQVNERLGTLEVTNTSVNEENKQLVTKLENVYNTNMKLKNELFLCRNPDYKSH